MENLSDYGKPDINLGCTSVIKMYEDSFRRHWNLTAMIDYEGLSLTYGEVAERIARYHIIFENCGVRRGDKISVCGRNCSDWAVAFLAIFTYGAVPVPILNDFKSDNIHMIVNHSESVLLIAGGQVWEKLTADEMPELAGVIVFDDCRLTLSRNDALSSAFDIMSSEYVKKFPGGLKPDGVIYEAERDENDLAILNYTSGTTSDPKGVMIPYRAVMLNMQFACRNIPLQHDHRVVAILPLAHMFGLSFQMMYELLLGCGVCFLDRTPTPAVLFKAFAEIKPKMILTVPLIIEKIVRQEIVPVLGTPIMKMAMCIPGVCGMIGNKIRNKIVNVLGGEMDILVIGGAALSPDVEKILRKIRFHYTVGYGTTECAPLIAYSAWYEYKQGSSGKILPGTKCDIFSTDSHNETGEILIKGPNVMLGYYKNPTATRETIDPAGWYHTGDIGTIDSEGNITIKGRSKNMIPGPSGQNIYPEEIEDILGRLPYVEECLVVGRDDGLVALVVPDYKTASENDMTSLQLVEKMEENRKTLNSLLPMYSQVTQIELRSEPFEHTPKKSIRRFLYK